MSLVIHNLQKSYGKVQVLRGVSLTIEPGTVHALLGPNGAGKSTVIKCLGGAVSADSGQITLAGEAITSSSPAEAISHGVATIHQHLSLIDSLSIRDNVYLGSELSRGGFLRRKTERRQVASLLRRFRLSAAPDTKVAELSIGVRQLVEIAKAWHRNDVRVLILDEPTASLSGPETERLFQEIEALRSTGVCILYTTHRLNEVFEIADDVTVIRDGAVVLQKKTKALTPEEIVRSISPNTRKTKSRGAQVFGDDQIVISELQGPRFGPVDLKIARCEIVGVFGAVGAGRTSLLETIAGRFRPSTGRVVAGGNELSPGSIRRARAAGVFLIPADRVKQSLWGNLSAQDNLTLPTVKRMRRYGLRSFRAERMAFRDMAERLQLSPPDPQLQGARFSGGNQQKLVVGRLSSESANARLFILDEPTQGVDVGARAQIYEEIRRLAETSGASVLFASSEPDEIVALADRAIVIDDGRIVGQFEASELTEERLVSAAHQFAGSEKK